MNKIYKVIWSEARKCYVVVAEIAKNHGKNNVRSIMERLAVKSAQAVLQLITAAQNSVGSALPATGRRADYPRTAAQWIVPLMLAGILLQPASAWATTITRKDGAGGVIDKNTAGTVFDIYAQEIATKGDFGVNRFENFSLDKGHIANMHFKHKGGDTTVSNLVNLVKERIDINGTVNAIKNNKIDGNLYFISKNGMTVGSTGVINAGSFTGLAVSSGYFSDLWDHTYNIGTDIEYNDDGTYKSGGLSSDLKNFGRRSNGSYNTMSDLKLATGSDKGIEIKGQINTRSGIVLGAGDIKVASGATLQSKKDIDFTDLVNAKDESGNTVTNTTLSGADLTAVADATTGDIILRAENTTSYSNNAVTSTVTEIVDSVMNSTNETKVEVAGKLESDGNVDVSASATSEWDNTNFNLLASTFGISVDDIAKNFESEMGISWVADWAVKNNKASVTLADTGSIKAGGDVYLQSDAKVDVKIKASTVMNRGDGTGNVLPVLAIAVGVTDNKAAVDVEGAVNTTGNLSMAANAETKLDISASANVMGTNHPDPNTPDDEGNYIFLGVSWAKGDNKAELNVTDPGTLGDNATIKAGGDISVSASSSSEISSEASATGKDETFASAAISVIDYDSQANVNLKRSMEGQSITGSASNSFSKLKIKAKDGNGEGSVFEPMKGISFTTIGEGNADTIAKKIKSRFNLNGITNNGKLADLKSVFDNVQEYVTAGAGIAVLDSENTARLTVAPDVELKATGPATIETTGTDGNSSTSESGYVSLSASTETNKLHHNVVGQANKQKKQGEEHESEFDIAAAVNYSNIVNNAVVELQSSTNTTTNDTGTATGARLTATNGNVTISVSSKEDYNAREAIDSVEEMANLFVMMLKKTWSDIKNPEGSEKSVTVTKQSANDDTTTSPTITGETVESSSSNSTSGGTTSGDSTSGDTTSGDSTSGDTTSGSSKKSIADLTEDDITEIENRVKGYCQNLEDSGTNNGESEITTTSDKSGFEDEIKGFVGYLETVGEDIDTDVHILQGLIAACFDVVDPASYTNYYVRSYVSDDNTNKMAAAVSLNISQFQNKSVVSVGEGSTVSAGKSITVSTDTKVDVVSGTGNGAEYFGFSQTNGNGVGASIAAEEFSGDSLILSGKKVNMTAGTADSASGDITLKAKNDMDQVGIILAAGEADSTLSATGSASALIGDSNSMVLVDDETLINTPGTLTVEVENDSTITNVVGGLTLGNHNTSACIGMGLALNMMDDNAIAAVADSGSDAATEVTDTTTDDFKSKTAEEQNKIKAENTLAQARHLAQRRTKGLSANDVKTDDDGNEEHDSDGTGLITSLGRKTDTDENGNLYKGSIIAKDVEVNADNGGTINAIAIEAASGSDSHSALETINKWGNFTSEQKSKLLMSAMGALGYGQTRMNNIFNKSIKHMPSTSIGNLKSMEHSDEDSDNGFNITATGSFAWNEIDGNTAAMIDNTALNLGGDDGNGTLYNHASDDVWNGGWAGSAAWNWYNPTSTKPNEDALKGGFGAAVGVNRLNRGVKAVVSNSEISGAGLVQNTAYKDGTDVAAAIGIGLTNDSAGESTNIGGSFGFAYNATDNDIHALLIDNTSQNSVTDKTTKIENSAYNEDIQVAGGLDFSYANSSNDGKSVGVGITCTISLLDNDMQSGIQGGSYENVSNMQVSAEEALTQVNAAVGLGFNGSEDGGFAGAGALAYSDLDNVTHAYISGTDKIAASGEVSAVAQDVRQKNTDDENSSYNLRKKYLEDRKVDADGSSYVDQLGDTNDGRNSSDVTNYADYSSLGQSGKSTIVNVAAEAAATTKSQSETIVAGAGVAMALVDNQFNVDIKDNKDLTADTVKGEANVGTDIVGVGVGVSYSSKSFGGAGSMAFNDLDQDNIVSITGNRDDNTSSNTDGNGDTVGNTNDNSGITANTVSGKADNDSKIINVAGDFAGGKNAIGLGFAYNRMDDTTGVFVADNNIQAQDSSTGVDVSLDADNDAYALAISVGAALTTQTDTTFAVEGNVALNRGHNDTMAVIGEDKDGNKGSTNDKISNAKSISVTTADDTQKTTIAGAATINTKGSKAGIGIAVALTESDTSDDYSGDGKESLRAEIDNADITTVQTSTTDDDNNTTTTGASISVSSADNSSATTVSVGVGYTKQSTFGAQGSGADARINKHNTAGMQDTTIDKDENKDALVDLQASTTSSLTTAAAALEVSAGGNESTLTGVVSVGVNRIKDDTVAGVTYSEKQDSTAMNVGNLSIDSVSSGDILSVGIGASVATNSTVTFGGSGSHNFIENNVTAKVVNADMESSGNVGVVAQSDEGISNYAGVVDVGIAGAANAAVAVGVTGSYNKLTGDTVALIQDSKVVAQGSEDHKIKTKSKMKEKDEDGDSYLIDGAVTSNTWSAGKLQTGRDEEFKTGVVVDASGTHAIASDMGNIGVAVSTASVGVEVAGVINLNYVSGSTTAKVLDSQINTEDTRSDVTVNAADYTNAAEFAGTVSVGVSTSTFGGAAGINVNVNEVDRTTGAAVTTSDAKWDSTEKMYTVDDDSKTNTVYAENFSVTADAVQAMSALNVVASVAASSTAAGQTGDNVNVNTMKSSTAAAVTNATVDFTEDAKVEAVHEDRIYDMNIAVGVAASATGSGSLNVGVGVIDEQSSATAGVQNSDIKKSGNPSGTNETQDISIKADNTTKMESTLVSVGVAASLYGAGIGSSISVNEINNRVTTKVAGSELTADNIDISTANTIKIKDTAGEGAGALIGAGIGIGVEVDTLNSTASTIISNSTLTADRDLSIETKTERDIEATVAGVGVGAAGISVNVLSVTVNDGINDLADAVDSDATDSDGNTVNFSHKDTINSVTDSVNDDYGRNLSENFYGSEESSDSHTLSNVLYGMSDDEKDEMEDKAETKIDNQECINGTGVHTYIQKGSELEAGGALTITNKELNDADLDGGSGSLGAVAVNVADVVFHLNEMSDIAVMDSSLKGRSVAVNAHQGNVTADKDDAIYARMIQASAGLAAIGVGYSGITVKSEADKGAGTGISVDNSTISATGGDLTLKSSNDARSKSEVIGASLGLMSVPISVTHNTNQADNFIEVTGGSQLTATSITSTQETTDADGNTTTETVKEGGSIVLQATRTGRVEAKTEGVGAGGEVWAVNVAKGRDYGDATIGVDNSGNTFTADTVAMQAVNDPEIHVEAGGISVSLTGVAVNQGHAVAGSEDDHLKAKVTVNDGNTFEADDVLAQAIVGDADKETGKEMAYAYTRSISVSLAEGGANKSKAITNTEAVVDMGEQTYKTVEEEVTYTDENGEENTKTVEKAATDLALLTENNASRHSKLGNTSVGIGMSISFGDAKATGNDVSEVKAVGGSSGDATKLKNLKINAGGSNTARGFADGDSGGILAVGASATITMETETTNTTTLSGAWDVSESADIGALQKVTGKGSSTTSSGGVLSVTWANSDNNITMNTTTELAQGAELTAGKSYVLAENQVVTGAYDGDDEGRTWNNNMSVGGVIQIAPDIDSEETITTSAKVDIGKNAKVTTENGQIFAAYADMDVYNYSKSNSGGLAENLWVYASTNIDNTNKITVNEGAKLTQNGDYKSGKDITLTASDVIDMDVEAYASAGGLEGVTRAHADNDIKRNNKVEVNGKLNSSHDINLYAGVDEDGANSQLNITGVAEADNNTIASLSTSPELNINLENNHQVKVGSSGEGIAIRNINVSAHEGSENVKKTIIKTTNLFTSQTTEKSLLSNEEGDENLDETNDNFVKVEGLLKTGYQNNVKVELTGALIPEYNETDEDGNVTKTYHFKPANENIGDFHVEVTNENGNSDKTETVIKAEDVKSGYMDYASYLTSQLETLNQLISEYNNGTDESDSSTKNTSAYYGYITQRQRIYDEMDKKHMYTYENVYDDDGNVISTEKVYITKGYTIGYAEIPDIMVSGGNITVQSDNLYGTGKLQANGKPKIEIDNYSNAYLRTNEMKVGYDGGEIRFQGESIESGDTGNEHINKLNSNDSYVAKLSLYGDSTGDGESSISVLNNNESVGTDLKVVSVEKDENGNSYTATYTSVPDVEALKNITNSYGSVSIENKQGNITISSASVEGKSVSLIANHGSVSQDYTEGVVNIGGNPKDLNSDKADELQNSAKNAMDLEATSDQTVQIADNSDVKGTDNDSGRIAGDSVYISADTININGLIQSGYAQYTAEIDEYVRDEDGNIVTYTDDEGNTVQLKTLSDKHIEMLKNNGSEVTVKGKTMYKLNDGNKAVYEDSTGVYKYVAQVYYDPESGGMVVEDIETQGGKIYLTGDICSTGNGRVVAADGGAEISITNNANADLATGKLVNNDLEGKISITDTAKDGTTYTVYTRNGTTTITNYDNYENRNKSDVEDKYKWTGTETITDAIGWYDKDDAAVYSPEENLRYNWTKGTTTTTTTYYHKVTKSLFWGAWKYSSDTSALKEASTKENKVDEVSKNGEPLSEGGFVDNTTIDDSYVDSDGKKLADYEFGVVGESWKTDETYTETDSWKESGNWWALWSNPKYHTTWTKTTGSTQTYTFSMAADKDIKVGFLGSGNGDGSITVRNTNADGGNVKLDGNVQSATKDATVTVEAAGGGISQTSGYTITTGKVDLNAKNNIEGINITSMGERIATTTENEDGTKTTTYTTQDGVQLTAVSNNAGNIDVEVVGGKADGQALPGNVVIKKLFSGVKNDSGEITTGNMGEVSLKAQGNITQDMKEVTTADSETGETTTTYEASDTVTVQGKKITLTSTNGTIGTFEEELNEDGTIKNLTPKQAIVVYSGKDADNTSEDSASVNAEAKSHIYLKEKEGDMRVGSVISKNGDVYMEATDGRLIDARSSEDSENNISTDDMIHKWIDAGLIAGTEDYEGAYMTELKQYAKDYHDRVEKQYEQFEALDDGEKEKSLKKLFTKSDGTYYSSAEEFLEQDATYQALDDTSKETYKTTVEGLYNQFTCDEEIQKKYTKEDGTWYNSVGEYLAQDEDYQQIVSKTNDDLVPYRRDVNEKWNDFKKKGADSEYAAMFTKEDGTTYDTVAEYMKEDATYQSITKEQDDYEDTISDEYTNFINNKSNGQLSDMFTKSDGTFYGSADEYLADDATFQAVIDKIENPQYAWTKEQMLGALRMALVNKETGVSAETQRKAANIQGNNVTLTAKGVGVHTDDDPTVIKVSDLSSDSENYISSLQQLANADAADVTMKDIDGNVLQYTTATVTRPNGHTLDAQAWKAYTYNEEGEKQLLYTQYASTETGEDGKTTVVWKTTGADGNEVKTWKTIDAEGNVVEVENDGSLRLYSFEIGNTSPLGVYATGRVDVKASGKDVYIAGRYADNAANTSSAENESGGGESASKDYSPINVGQITTAYQKVKTDENGNAVTDVEGNEVTEEARSNVRLYTQAGIYNADTAEGETINARIVGENLIAYGGEADIGKKDDMLTVDLSGDLLGAYAGDADDKSGNVYIRNTRTDDELRVGAVFAGDTICLESEKGFLRTTNDKYEGDAYLNAGKLVYLNATKTTTTVQKDEQGNDVTDDNGNPVTVTVTEYTGNIGTLADPIRILNNTGTPDNYGGDSANDGMLINLTGDNAYIRGVSGSRDMGDGTTMRLGLIDVKTDFVATSDSHIEAGAVRLGEGDEEGINGEITTREGNVKLDAEKNIVLNGPVTAGTVVKEENPENQEIFSYTGGNTINLISADGYIKQNGTGGLTAKKVDVVSGAGIKLTNDDNTFREFTAVGVEKNKTDEEGNVVYDNENNAVKEIAIDGSVDVRAHAGNTPATTGVGLDGNPVGSPGSALVAGFTESTTIYGDVALKNLDEGSLTVETKIVTKAGANGEAGDISFEQAGDIITLGDLDAANDINVNSDSGNIFLRNDIKAGQDITVSTGDDGVILLNDVANADNNVYAGRNVTLTSENTGLGVGGNVRAETGTVSATTTKGIINFVGDVYAGEDITAVIKEGDADSVIRYDGTTLAENNVVATANQGDIMYGSDVEAHGSVIAVTGKGDVGYNANVRAGDSVTAHTDEGDILVRDNIVTEQGNVTLTTADGFVIVGEPEQPVGEVLKGMIVANGDVSIATQTGSVAVQSEIISQNGNVSIEVVDANEGWPEYLANEIPHMPADTPGGIYVGLYNMGEAISAKQDINLLVKDGVITINGTTKTEEGDISVHAIDKETDQNIVITQNGKLDSGRDLTLHTYNGGIEVTDDTHAERNLYVIVDNKGSVQFNENVDVTGAVTAEVKDGDIAIGKTVNAGKEIDLSTGSGNITVGEDVTAGTTVNLTSGKGDITVGSGTSGNVKGAGDVTLKTGTGDVTINKTVTSTEGSIDIATGKGKIHIGDNGPNVKTVTAKKDVSLATENGKIEVYGKTSTAKGDITLKAANPKYKSGEDGQNIIIDHNGRIDSGRDATLIAKNGDLHVTDRVKAKRDVNAITEKKGDIFLDEDLTVKGSLTMQTDTGDIYADRYAKAGNRIVASTGKGDITVGTADAKYVSLTSGGKNSHTTAKTIRTEANGNSKGTGKEDIKLGGSYVTANSIVNKSKGSTPLAISTLGSSKDKAMKDFNIGTRNADGSYEGGIQSGSGAVVQQLWADNAMVYMAGKTNLHVSKAVVNNKLHAANDIVSLAVFGRTPTHDGERVVYWNDRKHNNPATMLDRWFNRAYTDPKWMYLDLFGNGNIGSRYGVLVDAHWYRNLYGDSVSVADTMRIRVEPQSAPADVAYFDRNNLIQINDDAVAVRSGEITME